MDIKEQSLTLFLEYRAGRKRSRSHSAQSDQEDMPISKRAPLLTSKTLQQSTSESFKQLQLHNSKEPASAKQSKPDSLQIDKTANHPNRLAFVDKLKVLKGPEISIVNYVDSVPCPPLDFTFVNDYVYREGVAVPDPNFMWGCECSGAYGCATTRASDCACGQENHEELSRLAYKHKGVLKFPEDNTFAIHECNDNCKCNWRCPNRVVLKGRQIPLEIFKTENKGWGLRCLEDLPAGQFIDRYVGEVITEAEAQRRTQIQESIGLTYLFDLDKFAGENDDPDKKFYCVDGADFGGVTRFINHSCDPNLKIHTVTHNRSEYDIYDLALFTCRKVKAGEELTFEYVKEMEDDEEVDDKKKWPCYCGAKKCRGWLW
ncbi:hypothetical protein ABW19_dt0201689 [Dactylella cylindrospora]|nr:hypothetical protein ABW19_dt0201689 [Dactylella cylindrospora]